MSHLYLVLSKFLEENGLAVRRLVSAEGTLDDKSEVFESDLTTEGVALSWGLDIDKWLQRIDRGGNPEDTKLLLDGLKEIRRYGVRNSLDKTRFYI